MQPIKNLIFFVLSSMLLVSSCKKEDKGDVVFFSNGSVSGTIKGTKADNTALNEQFGFDKYLALMYHQQYEITPQGYLFDLNFNTPDFSGIYLKFTLSSATDNTPEITKFGLDYHKYSGSNIFHFWMQDNNNSITLYDFSFNESTGNVKFKLVALGTNNSTGNSATVDAFYNVNVKKIVK
jgi:hypothetical protein